MFEADLLKDKNIIITGGGTGLGKSMGILLVAVQLIIGGLADKNILSINEAFEHLF